MKKDLEIKYRSSFDFIRYSNCWEDAELLLKALEIKENSYCLSICSAGDNSLAMLMADPELVVAFDINLAQIWLVELKMLAIKYMDYDTLLAFLGIKTSVNRLKIFDSIKNKLSNEAKAYFESNIQLIEKGVIHTGKFERYFYKFKKLILPCIHNTKTVQKLFEFNDISKQKAFYSKTWNSLRWKMFYKLFFNRYVMGRLGRDPEFFRYVEHDITRTLFERTSYAIENILAKENPYLGYIFLGNYENCLPLYLRENNIDKIRNNLDRLMLFNGTIKELKEKHNFVFDFANLSDIFEYLSLDLTREEAKTIYKCLKPGSKICYWNMMVDRRLSEILSTEYSYHQKQSEKLLLEDKAFFYKSFILEEAL